MPQPTLESLRRWDPERIGPFALLGRLGAGAMGQVYLGRSQAGRLVAVKTIKIELAEEPGFRDHFAHEVAAARRVSGMFTAAVVAADPEADVPWLATAYVPVPVAEPAGPGVRAAAGARRSGGWRPGCAEALESIHSAGLVHRDLKPSNVLVAPDGPRVIDFGVARAAERIQLTVTRGAVGTPAYMAPEQARDTRQASMASDVFALGATLLFAATGHAALPGRDRHGRAGPAGHRAARPGRAARRADRARSPPAWRAAPGTGPPRRLCWPGSGRWWRRAARRRAGPRRPAPVPDRPAMALIAGFAAAAGNGRARRRDAARGAAARPA